MLKATIVIRKEARDRVSTELIKEHCSKYLALYKIPHLYELKEELTISATGKKIKK
jgi:acyl-CoA synthetase (AMP-forming)/AMP-acid ligase II